MGLDAGRLRSRVTIRRATLVDDGRGAQVPIWRDVATIWAEVIGQNGREAVIAGALQGVSVLRVTIRYRRDLLATDQLRIDGQDYAIKAPPQDPDGRREALVILADTSAVEPDVR